MTLTANVPATAGVSLSAELEKLVKQEYLRGANAANKAGLPSRIGCYIHNVASRNIHG